jgi:hypothetical protein
MVRWLRNYTTSENPHVTACNAVALVLAWNQPYYLAYLWWIIGRDAWVGVPNACSGILLCAIPAINRRAPLLGRVAMVALSVANVTGCAIMLGEASGVQLLLLPCGMLAALLFDWHERFVLLAMTSLPPGVWLLTRERWRVSPVPFTVAEYHSLFTLNAVSAGTLMIFFGWILAGILRQTTATASATKPSAAD